MLQKKSLFEKNKTIIFSVTLILFAVAILAMILSLKDAREAGNNAFVPPEHETTLADSVSEDITRAAEYSYSSVKIDTGYTVSFASNVLCDGDIAKVYFTSDKANTAIISLAVIDKDKNQLGLSGYLEPGEILESIKLSRKITETEDVVLKFIGYEPETYMSRGTKDFQVKAFPDMDACKVYMLEMKIPDVDENSVSGIPSDYGKSSNYAEFTEKGFTAGTTTVSEVKDGKINLYLTCKDGDGVLVKVFVLASDRSIIAEGGAVTKGNYTVSANLRDDAKIEADTDVIYQVVGFSDETGDPLGHKEFKGKLIVSDTKSEHVSRK